MNHTTKEIYEHYQERGGNLPYHVFNRLITEFNYRVMSRILRGEEFQMGKELSKLSIIRIPRNYRKRAIDWGASNKLKKKFLEEGKTLYSKQNPDGEKWLIHRTDEWFTKFYWRKQDCELRNRSAYRLDITRGKRGNKTRLSNLLSNDPLAYLNFPLSTTIN